MENNGLDLLHYIEQDKMLQIIESFKQATDIVIDINDNLGFPLVEHDYFVGFCKYVRSTEKGFRQCIESNALVGYHSANKGQVVISPCHAGPLLMALPVMLEGVFLGSITCCSILLQEPDELAVNKLQKVAGELELDENKLIRSYKEINVISHEKCTAISNMIQLIINYVTELIYRSKRQEGHYTRELNSILKDKTKTELENKLRLAELKNLQSQIQPHFLFNTLNTLTGLVTLNENQKALDVAYSLSEILRYNLDSCGELVTLRDELRNVENYLQIKKIRFGSRLNYSFQVASELLDIEMPYLTLQPLVENACVHGLEPKEGDGYIQISADKVGDKVELVIEDNGLGIPDELLRDFPKSLKGLNQKGSIGLINVHSRLQLCFGWEFGVKLFRKRGVTRVLLLLPFR